MGIFNKLFEKLSTNSHFDYRDTPDFNSYTEITNVHSIFIWVFNKDPNIALEAAKSIHRLIKNASINQKKDLYNSLKNIDLNREILHYFDKFPKEIIESLLCISSLNSNGRVREEALNRLSENITLESIPYVIYRLADWVPVIKNKAENIIRNLINNSSPTLLIRHHKLIDWILKVERNSLTQIHQEIIDFIFSDINISELIATIDSYPEGDRYYIYRNVLALKKDTDTVLTKILNDKNFLIRLLAVKQYKIGDKPELLKILLKDKSQKIRLYSINKIEENYISLFRLELIDLSIDNSFPIRNQARTLLGKIDNINFYQRYLTLTKKTPTVGSILGLAETGTENDIDTIAKLISVESSKIRASVIYGISLLNYSISKAYALNHITDKSNTVKNICALVIKKDLLSTDMTILRELFPSGDVDLKRVVLKIISSNSGWAIAGDILKGIADENESIKLLSFAYFNSWYHYSVKLGITQSVLDINYVLDIYDRYQINTIRKPDHIEKLTSEIPFIFKRK
jgi:HEAT repeat protein